MNQFNFIPEKAKGCTIFDIDGNEYLDLYGAQGVISVGHSHPHYVQMLTDQIGKMTYYTNGFTASLRDELTKKLCKFCGYEDYSLYLDYSAAETNKMAQELAALYTNKKRIISSFPRYDIEHINDEIEKGDVAAIIINIVASGTIKIPDTEFMQSLQQLCNENNVILIFDETQSGFGRTGKFFAHQWYDIKPDIITFANGMGNGFPIAGGLFSPKFERFRNFQRSTCECSYLALTAAIAVIDIINLAGLMDNAFKVGEYLTSQISNPESPKVSPTGDDLEGAFHIHSKGLLIGIEFDREITGLHKKLFTQEHIFTGISDKTTLTLFPPLTLTLDEADIFIKAFQKVLTEPETTDEYPEIKDPRSEPIQQMLF